MTDTEGLPAAGWRDDPEDSTQLRYWDGNAWTEHRSPKAGASQAGAPQAGVTQAGMANGGTSPKKSGAPWWLAAVIGVVTLVIGLAMGVGIGALAFGGDDDAAASTTNSDVAPPPDDSADDATMTTEAESEPDPAPAAGGGSGSATDPLAIDTPWTYDTAWFGEDGTSWEGTFEGLVTLPVDEYDDDAGARCFAIVGTMSPTSIEDDAFTNNFFDTPSFEVVVGGAAQTAYGYCDYDGLVAAGYGDVLDAEVSVGTQYKFYQEVYLPSTVTADIDLIVLGSASDSEALFYQATPTSVG
jgi:hypothetical protein